MLRLEKNQGKAEAVRQGVNSLFRGQSPEFVGYWDADLSTPLEESLRCLSYFQKDTRLEIVFGSRLKKLGNRIERLWIRHVLGRIFATAVSQMLKAPVYDTQCGAKLFRSARARFLFAEPFVSRWFFDVEILWRHRQAGGSLESIFEMPVKSWVHVHGSKLTWKDFALTFWELNRIRRHYRRQDRFAVRGQ